MRSAIPAAARAAQRFTTERALNVSAKRAFGALLDRAVELGASPSAQLVLVQLWRHSDQDGRCWPSQARLSQLTRLSERTISTVIRELERLGLIIREQVGNGRGRRTVYKIPLANVSGRQPGCVLRSAEGLAAGAHPADAPTARPPARPLNEAPSDPDLAPDQAADELQPLPRKSVQGLQENKEPDLGTQTRAPTRIVAAQRRERIDAPPQRSRLARPPEREGDALRTGAPPSREREGVGFGPPPGEKLTTPAPAPDPRRVLALAASIPPPPDNPKAPHALAAVIARAELLHARLRSGGKR